MQGALIQFTKLFFPFLFGFSLSALTNTLVSIIHFLVNDLTPWIFIRGLLSLIRTVASSSFRVKTPLTSAHPPMQLHA